MMSDFLSTLSGAAEAISGLASLAFGAAGGVVLGSFAFSGFEVPDHIALPGKMGMSVHKLLGGERVIDMTGDEPGEISWSGTILDGNPWQRAQTLTSLRAAGNQLPLHFGACFYTVVIKSFEAKLYYQQVQYSISCAVVRNEATAPKTADPDLTNSIGGDIASALNAVPATLAPALSAAQTAVSALGILVPGSPRLAMAAASLNGVGGQLTALTSSAGAAIGAISGASSLASATSAAGTLGQSLQSAAYLGRALRNLS